VQLLLMAQQQISACETSCAFGTFKWLFLGVRTFMPFEVL
jgi:hypothetical protein